MGERREELSDSSLGVVEDAELSEQARPVVVEAFAGEVVLVVEREHRTRIELDRPAGAREPRQFPSWLPVIVVSKITWSSVTCRW